MGDERAGESLRFELIGPVRAWRGDRQLALGSPRRRAVAAVMLLHANQLVSKERLIRSVWGEPAPAYAVSQLQKYLSGLRQVLDPGRQPRSPSKTLHWSDGGYTLSVAPGGLDLENFEGRVAGGRTARAEGDLERSAAQLHEALKLWRGPVLANVSSPYLDGERDRLGELRATVTEERIEADLELGRHAEVVAELAALVAEFPLRERLRARLMTALYRCGRQAEALATYDETRRILRDDLGVDPGPEIQRLHARILRSDPSLSPDAPPGERQNPPELSPASPPDAHAAPEADADPDAIAAPGPRQLPMDIAEFTGRETELRRLHETLCGPDASSGAGGRAVSLAVIEGMAGVGKTRLAVHAAHRCVAAGHYDDMQLWADLKGFSASSTPADPADVLEDFLRLLGVPGSRIPVGADARAALYRDRLAGRRALVVLDDAADEEQVRLLLPGTPSCALLVTSRRVLTGLDGAHTVRLGTLSRQETLLLLARVSGRPDDGPDAEAMRRLAELSGRLPLAVALAARRLRTRPAWTVEELTARLETDDERLRQFAVGTRAVDTAFALSYRSLPADLRRAFRLLALHPGEDFTPSAAGALLGVASVEAERRLEALLDEHLLQQRTFGRYRYHDLLRLYAAELARTEEDEGDRRAAVQRLVDRYCRTAEAARHALEPWRPLPAGDDHDGFRADAAGEATPVLTPARALDWLARERANLLAVSREAAAAGRHHGVWRLAAAAHSFLARHAYGTDSVEGLRLGLAAARRMPDAVKQARIMRDLGGMYDGLGRHEDSAAQLHAALALSREADDVAGAAEALTGLGRASYALGRYPQSAEQHWRALTLFTKTADRHGQARARGGLGLANWFIPGGYVGSLQEHRRATALFEATGDSHGQAHEAGNLGLAHWALGNYTQCARHHGRALCLSRQNGDLRGQAAARHGLGLAAWHLGRPDAAHDHHLYALGAFRNMADWRGEAISLHRLGYVKWVTGAYRQGEELLHQALELAATIGSRQTEAWTLASLGHLCQRLQRVDEGRAHLQKALAVARTIGARQCESSAVLGLALHSLHAGQPDNCAQTAQRALAGSQDIGNPHGVALAMITLGLAASALRQPRQGADWHRQALQVARGSAEPFTQAMALTGLGAARTELGDHDRAARHLNDALAIRQRISDRHGEADTRLAMADLMAATGRPQAEQRDRDQALTLLTEIGAPAVPAHAARPALRVAP